MGRELGREKVAVAVVDLSCRVVGCTVVRVLQYMRACVLAGLGH